jgi:hypothetical protein
LTTALPNIITPARVQQRVDWRSVSHGATKFSNFIVPVCLALAGRSAGEVDNASDIPFGRVGIVGMKRFAANSGSGIVIGSYDVCNSRFLSGRAAGIGILSTTSLGLHVHFEWTRFELRSSRHLGHCDTGRPFFFTSNNGRSE